MPARKYPKQSRFGIVGYGGAFNMGRGHANWINAVPGLVTTAVCDPDKARLEVAQQELPGVEVYTKLEDMLNKAPIDNVVIITPHNTHAPLALKALRAGKGVITEKPFCLNIKEATAMIEAAKEAGVMLTVFHNRRWDGDFMALKEAVESGIIGEVFQIEQCFGGYGDPGTWWRANKAISGGAFYDWGAHFIDWLLQIMPGPMASVTGFFHKKVWMNVTNEDHVQAVVRFKSGAMADVQCSSIAMHNKPKWRVLGTKGAIVDARDDHFTLYTMAGGYRVEGRIPYKKSTWEKYYENIGDHLLRGKPLDVLPEQARRVIAIMDLAEKSSKSGKAEPVPYED